MWKDFIVTNEGKMLIAGFIVVLFFISFGIKYRKKISGLFILEKEPHRSQLITKPTRFFSKLKVLFVDNNNDEEPPEDYDGWLGV